MNSTFLNFKRICRLCLKDMATTGPMLSIFEEEYSIRPSFSDKIRTCSAIKVTMGDGLPTLICPECTNHVQNWFAFKQQCQQSDYMLRQHVVRENLSNRAFKEILDGKVNLSAGRHHIIPKSRCYMKKSIDLCMVSKVRIKLSDICKSTTSYSEDSKLLATLDSISKPNASTFQICKQQLLDPTSNLPVLKPGGLHLSYNYDTFSNIQKFTVYTDSSKLLNKYLDKHFSYNNTNSAIENDLAITGSELTIEPQKYPCSHTEMNSALQKVSVHASSSESLKGIFSDIDTSSALHDISINIRSPEADTEQSKYSCSDTDTSLVVQNITLYMQLSDNPQSTKYKQNLSDPMKCIDCNKSFKSYTRYQRHLAMHKTIQYFRCNDCGVRFYRKHEIEEHKMYHCSKQFKCKECGKTCYNEAVFNYHIRKHFKDKSSSLCSVCGKYFKNSGALKAHSITHSTEAPFLCNICGKKWKRMSALNHHLVVHSSERNHVCSVCNKTFARYRTLQIHAKSHSNERPFPCTICSKTFKTKNAYKKHCRVHTKEEPYVCRYCNRGFTECWNLTQHLRLHTGAKPYVCSVCQQAFRHNVTLRNHMKKHT